VKFWKKVKKELGGEGGALFLLGKESWPGEGGTMWLSAESPEKRREGGSPISLGVFGTTGLKRGGLWERV